jgi:hypothetical protein
MRSLLLASVVALSVAASARAQTPAALGVHARGKSFFAIKNEQVMHAFLRFQALPNAPNAPNAIDRAQDRLQSLRDRDALLLPAGRVPSLAAGGLGAAMLGATIVLAAHAPAPLRPLFDARVHFGPALFDGGGMGAGSGGRF